MSRRKETPKPFFSVRGDFTDSLDHFCQQSIMMLQAVETALDLDCVNEKVAPTLRARVEAFRAAMIDETPASEDPA